MSDTFEATSQTKQLQVHSELNELKKHALSIFQHLLKAKSLVDELAAIGKPLASMEFNAIVFCNIGSEFNEIVNGINLHASPVTFNELHSHLVGHKLLTKSLLL